MEFLIAVTAAALLASCQVKPVDSLIFKCAADTDCGAGLKCVEGLCRSPSTTVTGTCATNCSETRSLCCGTSCVDPATDSRNCGACGKACGLGAVCAGGTCIKETCDNGADDNLDGLIDCQDGIACPNGTTCRTGACCHGACALEASPALCSDGLDNDCDGQTDCADTGCLGQPCASGKVCLGPGSCASGCFIEDQPRLTGAARENAPCFACLPSASTTAWSPVTRGQASGSCQDQHRCDGSGGCRAANGRPCLGGSDCASGHCTSGACAP